MKPEAKQSSNYMLGGVPAGSIVSMADEICVVAVFTVGGPFSRDCDSDGGSRLRDLVIAATETFVA